MYARAADGHLGSGPARWGGSAIGRFVTRTLIPKQRFGRRLALIALVDSLGTGMFLASGPLYFTRVVRLTPAEVGIGLSAAGLVGLFGAVPIGILADRLGPGKVYIALQLWRGLGYVAYTQVTSFPGFLLIASCIGLADTAVSPVNQAMVGAAVPGGDRVETLAKIRALRNIGFAFGAAAATLVLFKSSAAGFVALVLADAASFFAAAGLLYLGGAGRLPIVRIARQSFALVGNAYYVLAALLNGVLSVHLTLLFIGLPLWIASHTSVPVVMIGFLLAVNATMTVVLQARFAAGARRLPGAQACVRLAGVALAAFGLVAFTMGQVRVVWLGVLLAIGAVILVTCGELWQSAGGWAVSYELAPQHAIGRYQATFQLGTALQSILGPGVIVGLVFSNHLGWIAFSAVTALAGLVMGIVVKLSAKRLSQPTVQSCLPSLPPHATHEVLNHPLGREAFGLTLDGCVVYADLPSQNLRWIADVETENV